MKKITFLLFLSILFMISLPVYSSNHNKLLSSYISSYDQNFTFVEKGITFSLFQSGEFDFYINRRNQLNTNFSYGVVNISYNSGFNYDPYLQYDDFGAIIQVEGVPIYYDYYGRAVRIGSVMINYHNNRITRVGGLHLYYNRHRSYYYSGFINVYNRNYFNHPYHNYFLKPSFNNCIVSYTPYRKHYKVKRHHYTENTYAFKKAPPKSHRSFRKINSRINSKSGERYAKIDRKSVRSNNDVTSRGFRTNKSSSKIKEQRLNQTKVVKPQRNVKRSSNNTNGEFVRDRNTAVKNSSHRYAKNLSRSLASHDVKNRLDKSIAQFSKRDKKTEEEFRTKKTRKRN